jgi:hypothetical protein
VCGIDQSDVDPVAAGVDLGLAGSDMGSCFIYIFQIKFNMRLSYATSCRNKLIQVVGFGQPLVEMDFYQRST